RSIALVAATRLARRRQRCDGDRPPRADGFTRRGGPIPRGCVGPLMARCVVDALANVELLRASLREEGAPPRAVGVDDQWTRCDRVSRAAEAVARGMELARLLRHPADDDLALAIGEAADAAGEVAGEALLDGPQRQFAQRLAREVSGPAGERADRRGL